MTIKLCLNCAHYRPPHGDRMPGCGFLMSEDCNEEAKISPITGRPFQHVDISLARFAMCKGDWWRVLEAANE